MVGECAHRDGLHQQRHTADVVVMIVGDQHEIQLLDVGKLHRPGNALQVPFHRPAGVDQQRLPGRSDEQRRLSAFYVDEVNLQRFGSFCCGKRETRQRDLENNK